MTQSLEPSDNVTPRTRSDAVPVDPLDITGTSVVITFHDDRKEILSVLSLCQR